MPKGGKMKKKESAGILYRLMRNLKPRIAKNFQKGIGPTKIVLLLTTRGRKSGLPRITPLQFEEVDGIFYVGSARGAQADWYKNILLDEHVELQIRERHLKGKAEPINEPSQVADFLEMRLKRHPLFIGLVMHLEGLPLFYHRADLVNFSKRKTFVRILPEKPE
jgi:deazaflavin-dependent oxidoreductase (nitroreductase family)